MSLQATLWFPNENLDKPDRAYESPHPIRTCDAVDHDTILRKGKKEGDTNDIKEETPHFVIKNDDVETYEGWIDLQSSS